VKAALRRSLPIVTGCLSVLTLVRGDNCWFLVEGSNKRITFITPAPVYACCWPLCCLSFIWNMSSVRHCLCKVVYVISILCDLLHYRTLVCLCYIATVGELHLHMLGWNKLSLPVSAHPHPIIRVVQGTRRGTVRLQSSTVFRETEIIRFPLLDGLIHILG
jgi:hypothetical protein